MKDYRLFVCRFGKDEVLFSFNDLLPLAILTGFITDLKVTYKYSKTCFGFKLEY